MFLLAPAQEIEIEREFVCAILGGALRSPGAALRVSRQARVSPVHLSYIRHGKRLPRIPVAWRIGRALPLPPERQEEWVHHVELMWNLQRRVRKRGLRLARDAPPDHALVDIQQAHRAATFTRFPSIAKFNYSIVKTLAENLIDQSSPNTDPCSYIQLAFLLHDTFSVLNRNDRALWYAKRARWVAEGVDDPREFRLTQAELDLYLVNAMRAEAVALQRLGSYRAARGLCERTATTEAFKRSARLCKPQLYCDLIDAIQAAPRFSITYVENLAEEAQQICDEGGEEEHRLQSLMLSISLARAFIAHRNFKDAFCALARAGEHFRLISNLGLGHEVSYLSAWARFYSARGDFGSDWNSYARRAALIATEAGLAHQLSGLRQDAGVHADEIMPNPENFH